MANAAAPAPRANMGEPAPRLDARLKVTGEARYASDFPVSNPAFACLVTSTIAKGRITALDLAEARAVPGVLDILTHENTGDLKAVAFGSASTSTQQLGPEIDHVGQIVAVVLADTFEAARNAARRVRVTYAALTPSATFGAQGLTEDDATKVSERIKEAPAAGDVEAALAAADVTIDAEYATPTQHHNPIELFTTTCAWHDNRLTIYEPSQFVYGLKNSTAKKLGIDPGQVRVVSPFVGGAFGAKGQLTPRTGLIALAAKRLNRPVKLVASRDQGFTIATYRAETGTISNSAPRPTASSSATAMRVGKFRRGGTLIASPAWKTAPGSTPSVRWAPRSTSCTPTATRRASCARRRWCPTSTPWKRRWTSSRSSCAWTRWNSAASTTP